MSNEIKAMSLIKEIQQCYDMSLSEVNEGLGWAIKCGEQLTELKAQVGHGNFGGFVEQYFDFGLRKAQTQMKLYKDFGHLSKAHRRALLKSAGSVNSFKKLLAGPKKPEEDNGEATEPIEVEVGSRKSIVWQAKEVIKTWSDAVGRWMSGSPAGIDAYREQFPGKAGDRVIDAAKEFYNALEAWKKGLK